MSGLEIKVPTVVEVPFGDDYFERAEFAVYDGTFGMFVPSYFKAQVLVNEVPLQVGTLPVNTRGVSSMIDNDLRTFVDFSLPQNSVGQVQIILISSVPVTSSVLSILLDSYVALPTTIEIKATDMEQGLEKIVVATKRLEGQTVRFLRTTSNRWLINLTYTQPLRIAELDLMQENAQKVNSHAVRFLAQPAHDYKIYFDPDRRETLPAVEAGNLATARDVLVLSPVKSESNPVYVIADVDKDSIPDVRDNCISVVNPDQQDVNGNGRGDFCDDFDQDSIVNINDNCPDIPNLNQMDTDGDKVGDVCDKKESRLTEKYKWIPWLGMIFAALVLVTLLALTMRHKNKEEDNERKNQIPPLD